MGKPVPVVELEPLEVHDSCFLPHAWVCEYTVVRQAATALKCDITQVRRPWLGAAGAYFIFDAWGEPCKSGAKAGGSTTSVSFLRVFCLILIWCYIDNLLLVLLICSVVEDLWYW